MKIDDMLNIAYRLLGEHNRKNWWVQINKLYDAPICWRPDNKIIVINEDKVQDMTPDSFKNEILKEISDMQSFELRGYHGRGDRHWNIIARFHGVKMNRKDGKVKKWKKVLVTDIPDDVI